MELAEIFNSDDSDSICDELHEAVSDNANYPQSGGLP